jgi:hypothetical protein
MPWHKLGQFFVVCLLNEDLVVVHADFSPFGISSDTCSRGHNLVQNTMNAQPFCELSAKCHKFTLGQRREIKKIGKSRLADHDLPFSTWSLYKLAEFLVAEGVVDGISHEGLRADGRGAGDGFT